MSPAMSSCPAPKGSAVSARANKKRWSLLKTEKVSGTKSSYLTFGPVPFVLQTVAEPLHYDLLANGKKRNTGHHGTILWGSEWPSGRHAHSSALPSALAQKDNPHLGQTVSSLHHRLMSTMTSPRMLCHLCCRETFPSEDRPPCLTANRRGRDQRCSEVHWCLRTHAKSARS